MTAPNTTESGAGRNPSREQGATPSAALLTKPPPPPHPRRILVADDEHLVATSLSISLGQLGYVTVGPASDGERAVQLARVGLPDMALLDIRMPRRDGVSAAAELFTELAIPVIIVSAYSDAGQVAGAADAGVFGYLVKPTTTEQLRAAIEIAWGRFCHLLTTQRENSDLRRKLEERKVIERAKWALVESMSITEPEAMDKLRQRARDSRRPMVEVALELLKERERE
jgi:response regulator NasT